MKNLFVSILLVAGGFLFSANGNLFPARAGNWWLFSYTIQGGGMGAQAIDSGTMRWQCMGVIPGNASFWIKVREERNLFRKRMTLVTYPPVTSYDSLFNPPRKTIDTLTLSGEYGNNGLRIDNDSCAALFFQPRCIATVCSLRTVQTTYRGAAVTGYEIDPFPCRSKGVKPGVCVMPRLFTQADNIGPIAFRSSLQPCIFDAIRNEQWTLVDHRAANRWIEPDTVKANTSTMLTLSTLEFACAPDSFIKSTTMNSQNIFLIYKPVYSPLKNCVPLPLLETHCAFTLPSLLPGKYPVFLNSQPSCLPNCEMPEKIELIDTLVVLNAAELNRRAPTRTVGSSPDLRFRWSNRTVVLDLPGAKNGVEVRLLDARGRLCGHARVWSGSARFRAMRTVKAGLFFIALDHEITRRCLME